LLGTGPGITAFICGNIDLAKIKSGKSSLRVRVLRLFVCHILTGGIIGAAWAQAVPIILRTVLMTFIRGTCIYHPLQKVRKSYRIIDLLQKSPLSLSI